eukprot:TRINITY_DN50621_c0_g1_i1.p1 TRINITY_DN50621_c0_g1~~TRINITY_DN50621_c0_g1_i1.p1  ORF type:complete len:561 (-),score=132.82 TRINITY_DN50621_c0_g1_i1:25-1707(-)
MAYYLGFDSSTQSIKATAVTADSLEVFKTYAVNFDKDLPHFKTSGGMSTCNASPARVTSPVLMWIEALDMLLDKMKADKFPFAKVLATSGSGQQHGSIYWAKGASELLGMLDSAQPLAPQLAKAFARLESPIWADSSTGQQCAKLEAAVGREALSKATGSRAYERFTGNQIAKIIEEEQAEVYERCERISLVSSGMCSIFLGSYAPLDTSDGSGTNLNDLQENGGLNWYWPALEAVAHKAAGGAAGLRMRLGAGLCEAHRALGCISPYFAERYGFSKSCVVVAWSGDNPCSLAGLGLQAAGDVAVSLGTSDTMFAMMGKASPGNDGHVFRNPVDPTAYMGMLCFKNGSLAREEVCKDKCGGCWERWGNMLSERPVGNNGAVGFYYMSPEITPTTGDQLGVWRFNAAGEAVETFDDPTEVRAVLEGKFLAMRAFAQGIGTDPAEVKRIIATGGASANKGILQVLADVFGVPVLTLEQSDSASMGAAFRACQGHRSLGAPGGFVSFPEVMSTGKLNYKEGANPAEGAKEVYTSMLGRFKELQDKVLAGLNEGTAAKKQRNGY